MRYNEEKLGDYIDVLSGFAFKTKDFVDVGVPIIKIKNICPPAVTLEDLTYVSNEIAEKQDKFILSYNDVLIAMTGSHINQWASVVGRVARVKYNEKTLLNQRVGKITIKPNAKADIDYVYYFLSQDDIKIELAAKAGGAANQANISPSNIKDLKFPYPNIETQHRIASILSAYDDLIENNQKQIKLLEEAAQRLYKEWFVDLRFPGYENTSVVDGVPEGWRKKTVLDMSAVLRRGISPKYNESGKYTVINQKCIRQTIMDIKESRKQEKEYADDMNLKDSDIVICSTGSGTLGRVGQVFGDYPDTSFDSHVTLIRAKNAGNAQFLFLALKNIQPLLMTLGQGSTNQLELPKRVIESYEMICPTDELIKNFQSIVQPIHDKITFLVNMIKNATEARDRLLPKLMSGELEV